MNNDQKCQIDTTFFRPVEGPVEHDKNVRRLRENLLVRTEKICTSLMDLTDDLKRMSLESDRYRMNVQKELSSGSGGYNDDMKSRVMKNMTDNVSDAFNNALEAMVKLVTYLS